MSGLNSPCLAACRRLSLLAFALVLVKNVIRVVPRVPLSLETVLGERMGQR